MKEEFKKGQIVYVNDGSNVWSVKHFSGMTNDNRYLAFSNLEHAISNEITWSSWAYCLSVEDYHKMRSEPKNMDLVWGTVDDTPQAKMCGFYSRGHKAIRYDHDVFVKYDSYEVIPRGKWPEWAVETYDKITGCAKSE